MSTFILLPQLWVYLSLLAVSEIAQASNLGAEVLCGSPAECAGGKGAFQAKDEVAKPSVGPLDVTPTSSAAALPATKVKSQVRISHASKNTSSFRETLHVNTSNLPLEYRSIDRKAFVASPDFILIAQKPASDKLAGVRSGDQFRATLEQTITASPSVPTPIRVKLLNGPYKGGFLLGQALFDRELKRVLLDFQKLRIPDRDMTYTLKASGLSLSGEVGLVGDYSTQEWLFFGAEMASITAAGYADATINRSQTAFGNYVEEPSLSTSVKKGAVSALSKSADRFAERARSAPEYTKVEGPQEILVLLTEDPIESR